MASVLLNEVQKKILFHKLPSLGGAQGYLAGNPTHAMFCE